MENRIIGRNIIELDSVDSTNKYGVGLLKNTNIEEGTVIFARSQYSGTGLNGNKWESESNKNITISIVLYPKFLKAEKHFYLNKIISVAIYNFVNDFVKKGRTSIKWPNDVYIDSKKVAGILIKNGIKGDSVEYSIVGIGVNLNQVEFRSNAPNPISIKNATHKDYDIKESINKLCLNIEEKYIQLKNDETESLDNEYLNSLLYYQKFNHYEYNGNIIEAKITGINKYGKLILIDKKNQVIECDMKEIVFVFE